MGELVNSNSVNNEQNWTTDIADGKELGTRELIIFGMQFNILVRKICALNEMAHLAMCHKQF